MNKSILDLLEEERKAVREIKFSEQSINDFRKQAEESKTEEYKEACQRIICDFEKKADEARNNLLCIRKEIKKYIAFLETL